MARFRGLALAAALDTWVEHTARAQEHQRAVIGRVVHRATRILFARILFLALYGVFLG